MALFSFIFMAVTLSTFVGFLLHDDSKEGFHKYWFANIIRDAVLLLLGISAYIIYDGIEFDVQVSLGQLSTARKVNECSDKYSKFQIGAMEQDFLAALEWSESGIRFAEGIFCLIALNLISYTAYLLIKKRQGVKAAEENEDEKFIPAINN